MPPTILTATTTGTTTGTPDLGPGSGTFTRIGILLASLVLLAAWAAPGAAQAQEVPYNRGLSAGCSSEAQTTQLFVDIGPGTHYESINCIAYHGVTLGYEDDDGVPFYAPFDAVTREQMASFIARMMERGHHDLPPSGDARPFDDVSAAHADNVERLRAAGVVEGRADGTYGARDAVTREQMASFIARAIETVTGDTLPSAPFFDDAGAAVHAPNVHKLTAIGVVEGRADGTYGPQVDITREQMASFLARAMDHLATEGMYDDEVAPLPGTPSTDERSEDATEGSRIAVTDVHVGSHAGFDRIVFEIDGDGEAGYHVRYVDEPTSPGSGEPIHTEGDASLQVVIDGAAYPADLPDGIEPIGDGAITLGGQAVVEVMPDVIFEGLHTFVAGTTGEQPFVVGHVDGNVVIDVFHAG